MDYRRSHYVQSFKYIAEHNHVAYDIGNTKVRVVYFFLQGGSTYIFFNYDKLIALFIVIDKARNSGHRIAIKVFVHADIVYIKDFLDINIAGKRRLNQINLVLFI